MKPGGEPTMNLQSRVVNILTKPNAEWPVIAKEPTEVASLYKEYIVYLAAIPPVCAFIGMTVIGISLPFFGTYRSSLASGISSLIVHYVLSLVGVFAAAFIVDKLAPTFQSGGGIVQALKMVAYASTPSWIAGVLAILPALSLLSILAGLYGIYLFYLGLPHVMRTPPEKVVPYMVVAAVVIIVIYIVIGSVSSMMSGIPRPV
jgi:hypothetical protein